MNYKQNYLNLGAILAEAVSKAPNHLYARYLKDGEREEVCLYFEQIYSKAQGLAAYLQSQIKQGARVILLFNSGLEFLIAFWGCILGGFIAVPANTPRDERSWRRIVNLIKDAQAELVLTTEDFAENPYLSIVRISLVNYHDSYLGYSFTRPNLHSDHIAFLQYTSGSTADPKGVIITHDNVIHNAKMIATALNAVHEGLNLVSWLPHYHDMGLLGCIITPALYQSTLTFMSPLHFLQRPARWLKAISRYQARVSVGPNFAYRLCTKKIKAHELEGIDLSTWTIALNGAEPVYEKTLEQFADAFAAYGFRKQSFFPTYGLAEATLFVSGGPTTETPKTMSMVVDNHSKTYVSCGKPGLGLSLAIIDPETNQSLVDNQVGEICISGTNVTQGYWRRPELNHNLFIDLAGRVFLKTGDLGFIKEGELYVCGRSKDLIIIRGRNIHAHDLEQSAIDCHSLLKAGIVAFGVTRDELEEVVLLVEMRPNTYHNDLCEVRKVVLETLLSEHGIEAQVVFIAKGSLLKTSSGKLKRAQCKQLYLAGALDVIGK